MVLKAPQNPFSWIRKGILHKLSPDAGIGISRFVVGLQEKPSVVPEHPWPYDQHLSENFTGNRWVREESPGALWVLVGVWQAGLRGHVALSHPPDQMDQTDQTDEIVASNVET